MIATCNNFIGSWSTFRLMQSHYSLSKYCKTNNINIIQQKKGKRLSGIFSDGNSNIELIWFKGFKWIKENIDFRCFVILNLFKFFY